MTRRSASYEHRLFKYAKRGFAIAVPNVDPTKVYTNRITSGNGLARLISLEAHDLLPKYHARKYKTDKMKLDQAELIQNDLEAEVLEARTKKNRKFSHYQICKIPYAKNWPLSRVNAYVNAFASKLQYR
jgi:hypothetical protein